MTSTGEHNLLKGPGPVVLACGVASVVFRIVACTVDVVFGLVVLGLTVGFIYPWAGGPALTAVIVPFVVGYAIVNIGAMASSTRFWRALWGVLAMLASGVLLFVAGLMVMLDRELDAELEGGDTISAVITHGVVILTSLAAVNVLAILTRPRPRPTPPPLPAEATGDDEGDRRAQQEF